MYKYTWVAAVLMMLMAFVTALPVNTDAWIEQLWMQDAFPVSSFPDFRDINQTLLEESEGMEYYLCPANSSLEIVMRSYGKFGSPQINGCCPTGQRGCMAPQSDRVLGCCPIDQYCMVTHGSGSAALINPDFYDRGGAPGVFEFVGCAQSRSQFCFDKICPYDGYVCCQRYLNGLTGECVPANNATDYTLCGELQTGIFPTQLATIGLPYNVTLPWSNWTLYSQPDLTYVDDFLVNGTQTFPSADPPLQVCNGSLAYCHLSEECQLVNLYSGFPVNNSIIDTVVPSIVPTETYCCPSPDYSLCLWPDPWEREYWWGDQSGVSENLYTLTQVPEFIGCALAPANETCCGKSICSDGNRCCYAVMNYTLNAQFQFQRNTTQDVNATALWVYNPVLHFCCPNMLECCFGDPTTPDGPVAFLDELIDDGEVLDPAQFEGYDPRMLQAFCGMELNDKHCALDKQRPPAWHKTKFYL